MQYLTSRAVPLIFALLVYLAIDNYGASEHGYNRQVAGYIFMAAATLFVAALATGRRLYIRRQQLAWGVAFVVSVAVSLWQAPSFYWSFNRIHLYYSIVLLGIAVYLVHAGSVGRVLDTYFLVIPLVHVAFLIYVVFWIVALQPGLDFPSTSAPHYGNIRHFAYHGFIAASCATALFLLTKKLQSTAFVLTATALFGIILLGARGALGAWLAFVLIILAFTPRRLGIFVFCTAALLLSAGMVYFLDTTGLVRAPTLFQRFDAGIGQALYVADRLELWRQSVAAILERPWFGYGPEGYAQSRCCNQAFVQPHNFILQYLLEFGFVGCSLLTGLTVVIWRTCGGRSAVPKSGKAYLDFVLLSAILGAFLSYSMIDGLLYHAIPLVHFALFAALLLALMLNHDSPPDRIAWPRTS